MGNELLEIENLRKILNAVAFDFEFFMYGEFIDEENIGNIYIIKDSENFKKLIPDWEAELPFADRVHKIIDNVVSEDDRLKLAKLVSKEYLNNKLASDPLGMLYLYGHFNYGKEENFCFMKFLLIKDENGKNVGITFGLKSIQTDSNSRRKDEEERKRKETAAISLSNDFEAIFTVNVKTQVITKVFTSDFYDNYIPSNTDNENYQQRIIDRVTQTVDDEDLEYVLKAFELNNVVEKLEISPSCHVTYHLKEQFGRKFTVRAKFTKHNQNPGNIILGIRFADSDVIDNQRHIKQLQIQTYEAKETIEFQIDTLKKKNEQLELFNNQIIDMLASVAEVRDADTGKHIEKVKGYTRILATEVARQLPEYGLTADDVELIANASVLHDIGKIMVPDAVLLKPGKLTPEEFDIIKLHCQNGVSIIDKAPADWSEDFINYSKQICLNHHEKWDGRGYPNGLVEDEIPISAQIVSIADCFDALCTDRVYKKAYPPKTAFEMIMDGDCGAFSPKLLECFRNVYDDFDAYNLGSKQEIQAATTQRKKRGISQALVVTERSMTTIKQLATAMPIAFCLFKREEFARMIYFNKALIDLCECDTEEGTRAHLKNGLFGLVNEEDIPLLTKRFNEKLLYNSIVSFETSFQTFKGNTRWINIIAKKAYSENANDVYYAFIKDNTRIIEKATLEETLNIVNENFHKIEKIESAEGDEISAPFEGIRALLIDPEELSTSDNNESIKTALEREGAFVAQVQSGYTGAALLARDTHFDVVLIDLNDIDDVISTINDIRLLAGASSNRLSIIVISDDSSETLTSKYIQAGANCTLKKPFSTVKLSRALISTLKQRSFSMESQLADTVRRASTDALTKVKNSTAHTERVAYLNAKIKENVAPQFGVVLCDIDDLKEINDKFGHAVGDVYIKNCSRLMCNAFPNAPVYRIGGDEFSIIVTDFELKNIEAILANLQMNIDFASKTDDPRNGKASFSFGYSIFNPNEDGDVECVIKRADALMYSQKRSKGDVR